MKAKGSPKTGGRKKGTPNIMTRELKRFAVRKRRPWSRSWYGSPRAPRARLCASLRSRRCLTAASVRQRSQSKAA